MRLSVNTKTANLVSLGTLILSGLANVALFLLIFVRFFKAPICHEHSLEHQILDDERQLNGQAVFPIDSTAYLSHVVIAMHESGAELKELMRALSYWKRYPPCTHNGYPSNWASAHVKLTFLLDRLPTAKFAEAIIELYQELPRAVKSCFAGMEVRQAGVQTEWANLIKNNSTKIDDEMLGKLAEEERDMFEALFTNKIELESPSYVLVLTPDTIPIQANWMNLMDYQTRVPIERFWMEGSLFRGPAEESVHKDARAMITMAKTALYNIGDPAFGKFYSDVVRPFIKSLAHDSDPQNRLLLQLPVEHDFSNYLFQWEHYGWVRMLAALFRPTDVIQDYSGVNIDVGKIQHDSPDTLIVKGIAPDLAPLNSPKP